MTARRFITPRFVALLAAAVVVLQFAAVEHAVSHGGATPDISGDHSDRRDRITGLQPAHRNTPCRDPRKNSEHREYGGADRFDVQIVPFTPSSSCFSPQPPPGGPPIARSLAVTFRPSAVRRS